MREQTMPVLFARVRVLEMVATCLISVLPKETRSDMEAALKERVLLVGAADSPFLSNDAERHLFRETMSAMLQAFIELRSPRAEDENPLH